MSLIEEYDKGLEHDIRSLERYIDKDEESAKIKMQNHGYPKEVADGLARDERAQGRHLYFDYPACVVSDELLVLLKRLSLCIKDLPFRILLNLPAIGDDWLSIRIITECESFLFDTAALPAEQQEEFVEYMQTLLPVYRYWLSYGIRRCYPSEKVMRFVAEMLKRFGTE